MDVNPSDRRSDNQRARDDRLRSVHRVMTHPGRALAVATSAAVRGDAVMCEVALRAWDRAGRPGGADALAPALEAALVYGNAGAARAVFRRGLPTSLGLDPSRREERKLRVLLAAMTAGGGKFSGTFAGRTRSKSRIIRKLMRDALGEEGSEELYKSIEQVIPGRAPAGVLIGERVSEDRCASSTDASDSDASGERDSEASAAAGEDVEVENSDVVEALLAALARAEIAEKRATSLALLALEAASEADPEIRAARLARLVSAASGRDSIDC